MTSRKTQARRAGLVYIVMSLLALPSLLDLGHFMVAGDAAATTSNIMARADLWRLIMLAGFLSTIGFLLLGWMLYHLFEEVDRRLAMLLLLFVIAAASGGVFDVAVNSAPLVLLGGSSYLSAFTPEQLRAFAYASLKLGMMSTYASEMFWGLWLVPLALLILKSRWMPKVIGIALFFPAVGYVMMSATFLAFPAYSEPVRRIGMILAIGELGVVNWLAFVGVREQHSGLV